MGYARPKPERLAEKLRHIRITLGLSQTEMHRRLEADEFITYTQISKYESGLREPPLQILLRYARVAGIHLEVLADDELDLPEKLPGNVTHTGSRRKSAQRSKRH
jgi:transcriptional regulator with XRE-family HTH domain